MPAKTTRRQPTGTAVSFELAAKIQEHAKTAGFKAEIAWMPNPMQIRALLRREFEVLVAGSKFGGKELANSAELYTPTGSILNGDVEVGNCLLNPDGGWSQVIGVWPQGIKPMFQVGFSDGSRVRAGASHLWKTRWNDQRWKQRSVFDDGWRIHTTQEMVNRLAERRSENTWQIPLTRPLDFWDSGPLPIDPYILGVILGDGYISPRSVKVTNPDSEIEQALQSAFPGCITADRYEGKCQEFRLTGESLQYTTAKLASLGLENKRSQEKFVPKIYKFQSATHRWALLQGLMDTDGYADTRGHTSFSSSSKQLATDVQWLVRSLGGNASISVKGAGYRKLDGEWRQCLDSNTVWINMPEHEKLFRVARKRERAISRKNRNDTVKHVVSIEPDGEEEATCITVDHPNQLYVTDDFIVTHNTDLGIMWLVGGNQKEVGEQYDERKDDVNISYLHHPRFLGAVIRLNEKDLAEWIDRATPFYEGIMGGTFTRNPAECRWPSGARIFLGHAGDSNAWTKYQGQNITKFLIEEAGQIPDLDTFDNIRSCCRSVDPDRMRAQILLTANPGGPGTQWLMDRYIEPKDREGRPIMHPVHKRPILDSDRGLIPIVETVTNPFNPQEKITTDRVWVPSYLQDNPIALKNTAYIGVLASMANDKLRKAYLYGDWKALRGAYYDNFNPDVHTYDPEKKGPLPSWWKVTGALDWGYVHETAVLWHKRDTETGQHLVFEEFCTSRTDPVELGAELARRTLKHLRVQETVVFYVSHDLYHNKIGDFSYIELIGKGVEKILGAGYCYIPDMIINRIKDRLQMEGKRIAAADEERILTEEVQGIVFRRAPMATPVVWMHIRTLMRTEPISSGLIETPNYDMAVRIMEEGGADAYVKYLKSFNKKKEILPELLISRACPRLVDAIPKLKHSEKNPETVDDRHFLGRDVADSLAYLTGGIRDEKPTEMPVKMEQERRLEAARLRRPDLTYQDMVYIAMDIEERQKERDGGDGSFELGRSALTMRRQAYGRNFAEGMDVSSE